MGSGLVAQSKPILKAKLKGAWLCGGIIIRV